MATRYWTNSAGDGSISNASNWSPSGAPAASDVLVFAEGTAAVVGGDYTALGAMAEIRIGSGFVASFGSATAYVEIESDDVVLDSSGTVYLDVDCNTATSSVVVLGGKNGTTFLYLRGDIQELRVVGGNGTIWAQAATEFSTGSGYTEIDSIVVSSANRVVLTIDGNVSSNDTISIDAGSIESECAVGTLSVYGGTFQQDGSGAITTANIYGNGYADFRGTGNITTLSLSSGTAHFRSNESDGVTVTNATINGGLLDLSTSLRNITFTNNISSNGGTILPPLGSTITVTYS